MFKIKIIKKKDFPEDGFIVGRVFRNFRTEYTIKEVNGNIITICNNCPGARPVSHSKEYLKGTFDEGASQWIEGVS